MNVYSKKWIVLWIIKSYLSRGTYLCRCRCCRSPELLLLLKSVSEDPVSVPVICPSLSLSFSHSLSLPFQNALPPFARYRLRASFAHHSSERAQERILHPSFSDCAASSPVVGRLSVIPIMIIGHTDYKLQAFTDMADNQTIFETVVGRLSVVPIISYKQWPVWLTIGRYRPKIGTRPITRKAWSVDHYYHHHSRTQLPSSSLSHAAVLRVMVL